MTRFIWLLPLGAATACSFDGLVADDQPGDDQPPVVERHASCRDARDAGETASGVYSLDPGDGGPAFDAYCNMDLDGGGWTLAIKADGGESTFDYDAAIWSSPTAFNPDVPGHDRIEAVLDSYSRIPADEILVETDSDALSMNPSGDAPLFDRITDGNMALALPHGALAWIDLVPDSWLPINLCPQLEGLNVGDDEYAARIGIVATDEDHDGPGHSCSNSFDAVIGVGTWTEDCYTHTTVGNIDDECFGTPAFAYVYVR